MVAVASARDATSNRRYVDSAKSRHPEWPRAVRLEYPEKCTHRYYADTKAHRFGRNPSPGWVHQIVIAEQSISDFAAASRRKSPSLPTLLPLVLPPRVLPIPPLCSLLISRRYCAPLFRQFCPRRIAGVIDKTSKSAAHASNKIVFAGPVVRE